MCEFRAGAIEADAAGSASEHEARLARAHVGACVPCGRVYRQLRREMRGREFQRAAVAAFLPLPAMTPGHIGAAGKLAIWIEQRITFLPRGGSDRAAEALGGAGLAKAAVAGTAIVAAGGAFTGHLVHSIEGAHFQAHHRAHVVRQAQPATLAGAAYREISLAARTSFAKDSSAATAARHLPTPPSKGLGYLALGSSTSASGAGAVGASRLLASPRRPARPRALKTRAPKPRLRRRVKATHLPLQAEAARASDTSVHDEPGNETRSAVRVAEAPRAYSLQGDLRRRSAAAHPRGDRTRGPIPRLRVPHSLRASCTGRRMERLDDRAVHLRREHLRDGWSPGCRTGSRNRTHGQHRARHLGVQRSSRRDAGGGDTLARWRCTGGAAVNGTYQFWFAGPTETGVFDECVALLACTGRGNGAQPLAAENRVAVPAANLGGHLYINAACTGVSGFTCPANPGDAHGYAAVAYLYAADLVLEQTEGPSSGGPTGPLATEQPVRGASPLIFSATDPGAGIYEAIFTVDGHVVQETVVNENGGHCRNVGQTADGLPAFLYLQPCPKAVNADVGFDSTRVANGTHHLTVTVSDAAGNTATVLDRTIVVENELGTATRSATAPRPPPSRRQAPP